MPMGPSQPASQTGLAIEAELAAGSCRFVRERVRLPMGLEASFGWLRHPPTVMVVPRRRDGLLLVVRRCRPAVGRWVLEFPSGPLEAGEAPAAGAERLLRRLTGVVGGPWHSLGHLRPNPGYSDELLVLGQMELEEADAEVLAAAPPAEVEVDGTLRLSFRTPADLDATLSSVEETVDGRSASAWFLAKERGSV